MERDRALVALGHAIVVVAVVVVCLAAITGCAAPRDLLVSEGSSVCFGAPGWCEGAFRRSAELHTGELAVAIDRAR